MQVILFEDNLTPCFFPLALTRPVGELRIGILTIREKWEKALGHPVCHETRDHLRKVYNPHSGDGPGYFINARMLPTSPVVDQIRALDAGESIRQGDVLLAARFDRSPGHSDAASRSRQVHSNPFLLNRITDVFALNGQAIELDFPICVSGRSSLDLPTHVTLIGPSEKLFISEDAKLTACTINTTGGPVFIGKGAEVMEGCLIRGPLALGEQAVLKMGSKVYGPTTIGPHCRVGGEVTNSVILGYSNKGHDGFLGNSVLGEWCNLGADTNTSNLKNNYGSVRTWDYANQEFRNTGLTFVGLIMGDHSKSGINTMFNTGTVTGVAANIFGGGFPPKFIPSFSWGGPEGMVAYRLDEALLTAERMMARRQINLTPEMREMLTEVFRITSGERQTAPIRQD